MQIFEGDDDRPVGHQPLQQSDRFVDDAKTEICGRKAGWCVPCDIC
ncbi:MAG TPA: hypothetical protein VE645_12385 [Pseudonocardiaceae bacterium]|nr:hypothetical protein [Pseudonocardiaceae bacterium]